MSDEIKVEVNLNSRYIYPPDVIEKAVAKFKERIDADAAFGEINPANIKSAEVDLSKAAIQVTDMEIIDNNILASIKPLDTSQGDIVKQCLDNNLIDRFKLVPRGYTHVNHTTKELELLTISSIDIVGK